MLTDADPVPAILGLYQSVVRAMAASPVELFVSHKVFILDLSTRWRFTIAEPVLWMDLGQPERLTVFGFGILSWLF